ncbi:hypothetical protein DFJ58DRAFT_627565, partial [Suillus subalutaceus]|uniref:uncharacterized protein n=1 Tax=Suillus subalutaceus TaxID=48586 RepID=UPI001B862BBD
VFDAKAYRGQKTQLVNYAASPKLLSATMWQHTTSGLELVDSTDEMPFKLLIAGRVSAFRLKVRPEGSHMKNGMTSLDKAKYQFHLTHPADTELGKDYNAAISTLETLQSQVATTKD